MKGHIIQINGNIFWQFAENRRTGQVVAACPMLKITVQAENRNELNNVITDSINLLFRDLVSTGDFDAFLREQGWRLSSSMPPRSQANNVRFNIPVTTNRVSAHDLDAAFSK